MFVCFSFICCCVVVCVCVLRLFLLLTDGRIQQRYESVLLFYWNSVFSISRQLITGVRKMGELTLQPCIAAIAGPRLRRSAVGPEGGVKAESMIGDARCTDACCLVHAHEQYSNSSHRVCPAVTPASYRIFELFLLLRCPPGA